MSMVEFTDPELYLLRMAVFARMATCPSTEYKDLENLLPRLGYPQPDDVQSIRPRPVVRDVPPVPVTTWAVGGSVTAIDPEPRCTCGYTLSECHNSEIAAVRCNRRGNG